MKWRLVMARNTTQKMLRNLEEQRSVHGTQGLISENNCFLNCVIRIRVKNDRKRIDAFEMWCYRRLLRVFLKDKKTNEWVLRKIYSDVMFRNNIESKKLRHTLGINAGNRRVIEKDTLQEMIENRPGKGSPPAAWMDSIKKHTGLLNWLLSSRNSLVRLIALA